MTHMKNSSMILIFCSLFFLLSTAACASSEKIKSDKSTNDSSTKKNNQKKNIIPAESDFFKSPIVKKIHKRQARRLGVIQSLKKKGVIGEAEDGLLKIRDASNLSKKDKVTMEKLVKVENKDRIIIFKDIAKRQKFNEFDYNFLRRNMFDTYLDLDPIGTYYYSNRAWLKK